MLTNISNCRETLSSFCIHELGIRGHPFFSCLGGMLAEVPFSIMRFLIVSLSSANLGGGRLSFSPLRSYVLQLDFVTSSMTMIMAWC